MFSHFDYLNTFHNKTEAAIIVEQLIEDVTWHPKLGDVTFSGTGSVDFIGNLSSEDWLYNEFIRAVHFSKSLRPSLKCLWFNLRVTVNLLNCEVFLYFKVSGLPICILFKENIRTAAGLEAGDVQFATRVSPGSYLSLSVTIIGFDFGSSTTMIRFETIAVLNEGPSVVTSQLKFPDKLKSTSRRNTCVAFDTDKSTLSP